MAYDMNSLELGEEGVELGEDHVANFAEAKGAIDDGTEAASIPSADDSSDEPRSGAHPFRSRKGKVIALLAAVAVVLVVALTAGLVVSGKNKNNQAPEVSSAMLSATDGSAPPTLPLAGSVSNDFDDEEDP